MQQQASKIAARTIRNKPSAELSDSQLVEAARNRKVEQYLAKHSDFRSLSEKVARSKDFRKNWYFDGGKESFPQMPQMWFVEKYFPYAEGGPLLVDEPKYPFEVDDCIRKAKFLKKKGYRYCYIERDSTLEHVLTQLGEL